METNSKETPTPSVPEKEQVRQRYSQGKKSMVRKLFYLAYQMGWGKPTSPEEVQVRPAMLCKLSLNRWLMSDKSAVRKEVDNLSHSELVKVTTQLEIVYRDYLKRI